ncbi:hypothetical protein ACFVTT_15785 [Streptomyces niveus]|uniref:hypothetical protein n=1 Tax=Streptomyces niveus TaxID=193462 RepID=UPI003443FCBF
MSPTSLTARPAIPAAVAAVIAAVVAEHPLASPGDLGRLAVAALDDDGWRITPEPFCAPMSAEFAPCRPKSRPARRTPATR